jgi:alkanesulfonate monooxygenase SsuD/methylene tetrahydromethanopterin reductase-like flavin-dependent oxidoreductase (luciferase family)
MESTRYSVTMPIANSTQRHDADVYAEIDRRYDTVEELGFDTVFNLEHHFGDYIMCPDTMLLHAYVAARTERIRLSNAIIVAPWHNPIRLAEQISMVDLLSGGRTLPGLGRGNAVHEHRNLGVDPEESKTRFDECVEVLQLALTGEEFSYRGPFHSYENITVRPRPDREITLAAAATSPGTAERLGAMGLHLLIGNIGQPVSQSKGALEGYQAAAVAAGHDLARLETIYHGLAYVADTDEQAYDELLRVVPEQLDAQARFYEVAKNRWKNLKGYEYQAQAAEAFQAMVDMPTDLLRLFLDGHFVGSPETVARRIKTFVDFGYNHISFYCEWGGTIPVERELETFRRLMCDVVPIVSEVEAWDFEETAVIT